jgi:RNA polymerase sigma-70 factor (ECF subfamily)
VDDTELAQRVAQGDELALEMLVVKFYRPLFRFLWQASGSREDADELTSQAFLRATADIGRFRAEGSLRAWIFRVGHRELLRYRRRQAVAKLLTPKPQPSVGPPNEDFVLLTAALQRLSLSHREAFLLVEVEGFTMDEAGLALHVPAGTVKSRCHHAKQRLRELLAPAYPEVSNYVATVPD